MGSAQYNPQSFTAYLSICWKWYSKFITSQKEEEEFVQNGFISTSLGNQILRVETVPLFILSIVRYEYMEWYYGKNKWINIRNSDHI